MLLIPLTPIFLPASAAMVVMRESRRDDQRAGVRPQGGGLGQDAEPGPRGLRGDISDVAPGADVDLALQLVGDDRLGCSVSARSVTCSPCWANSPRSCAMYSPARSTAGMAATVMSGSSGAGPGSAGTASAGTAPLADEHPAETIMITAAQSAAIQELRAFIGASVNSCSRNPSRNVAVCTPRGTGLAGNSGMVITRHGSELAKRQLPDWQAHPLFVRCCCQQPG